MYSMQHHDQLARLAPPLPRDDFEALIAMPTLWNFTSETPVGRLQTIEGVGYLEIAQANGKLILRMMSSSLANQDGDNDIALRFVEEPLSTVAAHTSFNEAAGVRRRIDGLGLHAAIHSFEDGSLAGGDYCQVHTHEYVHELNFVSSYQLDPLAYDLTDGHDSLVDLRGNRSFFFPSSQPHCAMAVRGAGHFIVMRIPDMTAIRRLESPL